MVFFFIYQKSNVLKKCKDIKVNFCNVTLNKQLTIYLMKVVETQVKINILCKD